jgi:hypothetical protein
MEELEVGGDIKSCLADKCYVESCMTIDLSMVESTTRLARAISTLKMDQRFYGSDGF